ncbi:MAG: hypothetical protein MJE63_13615 [Proteobacteria bacterium]|nr:hypothetical protein [Pseudomonadota bacterium]
MKKVAFIAILALVSFTINGYADDCKKNSGFSLNPDCVKAKITGDKKKKSKKTKSMSSKDRRRFKSDFNKLNKHERKIEDLIYSKKEYQEAKNELELFEKELKLFVIKANTTENDKAVAKYFRKIKKLEGKLEKKMAAQKSSPVKKRVARKSSPQVQKSNLQPGADAAFNANKDELLQAYQAFKKLNQEIKSRNEVPGKYAEIKKAVELGNNVIKKLDDGIGNLRKYEKSNAEAKKMQLSRKVRWVKKEAKDWGKAADKVPAMLEKEIKSDLSFLKKHANYKTAQKSLDRISDNFVKLDKTDSPFKQQKSKIMAEAKKKKKKIMDAVKTNKMPKSAYKGWGEGSLVKKLKKAYRKRYGKDAERIVITSPRWQEKTVMEYRQGAKVKKTTKYLFAHVAVKKPDLYKVFEMTFAEIKWQGEGFGPLHVYSVGKNYPVVAANINK